MDYLIFFKFFCVLFVKRSMGHLHDRKKLGDCRYKLFETAKKNPRIFFGKKYLLKK